MSKAITPPSGDGSASVSIRKIENGYITREEHYARGKFSSKETFSTKPPSIVVPTAKPAVKAPAAKKPAAKPAAKGKR
jgi:hypothetical protein